MKTIRTVVYGGPNIYALFPVIRLTIDLEQLEHWPTAKIGEEFVGSLVRALPGLAEHGCSYGTPGGLLRRMREDEGTWLGHVFEHVVLELQNVAGAQVNFGKTRSTGEPGHYYVVYEFEDEDVALEAGELALRLLQFLLPSQLRTTEVKDFDWVREREAFIRFAQRRALGPSTMALVKAAEARKIPWLRINTQSSLMQLGHGRYQQRVQATITSQTRHIAVELASDKEETNRLLGDLGLPAPRQRLVFKLTRALEAAERIGYPVVVKPLDGNHGRGVAINLQTPEQVEAAYDKAREFSDGVIVEGYVSGFDHRLLIVDGRLVAAAKRVPGHVVGDGRATIAELVKAVNQDPRRGVGHERVLTRLELDHQAKRLLAMREYDVDTVPPPGEMVFLRATANLSTGGTAIDVTDEVHPDNCDMAIRAARAVGLDVAGVDFITEDIGRSFREVGGAIVEINAAPGFRMHVAPTEGQSRDVAGPVVDMLFPHGAGSRIPIAAITGTNGKTTTTRMVGHVLKMAGFTVGMATTDGVYIDGELTVSGDMTGPRAAQIILRDPSVDAAVLETARGGIIRRGMGYRSADVACCLNVATDHLGQDGIDTLEQLAEVKRVVIEVASGAAVLNADDPHCLRMADFARAERIVYVTMNPAHSLVKEHIRLGGAAVVLEEGMNGHMITLYDQNGHHIPLVWTHLIPATLEGRAIHNVQNAMFAAAMAHELGVSLDNIRHGLRTFGTTYFQAPGRLNIFDEHPFKVILDYAHNPAAVRLITALVRSMEVTGRRILVFTVPGDRRDQEIIDMAQAVAGNFDHYICREDADPRGRAPGEVADRLQAALVEAGVPSAAIERILDEEAANNAALCAARPGDLVLTLVEAIAKTWKQIIYFQPDASQRANPAPTPNRAPALPRALVHELDLASDVELIRDERGVRIAARDGED